MYRRLDKLIHEPVRLQIMAILARGEEVDFNFLTASLKLSTGNLSRHVEKLEAANYVKVKKTFSGNFPNTGYQITRKGSAALAEYWKQMDAMRRMG